MGGITNGALSVIAANMTGSALPYYTGIGTSGISFAATQTTLGSETDKNVIDSNDLTTGSQVTFITNWTPLEISGTVLKEFGVFTSGNTMVSREVLTGSEVFDGEQELQVQQTYSFFN